MAGLIPIVFCDTNRIIMYLDVCFRLFFCCLWRGSACSRDVSCCIWSADLFVLHIFLAVFFRLDFMVLHICVFRLTSAIKQCLCCWILCVLLLAFYCICIVTCFSPRHLFCIGFCSVFGTLDVCLCRLFLLVVSSCRVCTGHPRVVPCLLHGNYSDLFLCPIGPMWSLFGYLGRFMR